MEPIDVTIAPTGIQLSPDLLNKVKVVDTGDRDIIDALSEMKVAPADTIFLMDSQRAVFLVNNCGVFNIAFRILHPIEDDMDIFNAAWIGLEKFNDVIKETELILKHTPKEDEDSPARGRFTKQYARIDKNGDVKGLRNPSYTALANDEIAEESDDE